MVYLEPKDLRTLFKIISQYYCRKEEVPQYDAEQLGMNKLLGVLSGIKSDLYPSILDKATYLLISVNKGHFFSNGNKRLSLVVAIAFLIVNDMFFKGDFESYKSKLQELFPKFVDFIDDEFKPVEFGFYNLSIIIADNHSYEPDFDRLKTKVRDFLEYFVFIKRYK